VTSSSSAHRRSHLPELTSQLAVLEAKIKEAEDRLARVQRGGPKFFAGEHSPSGSRLSDPYIVPKPERYGDVGERSGF
jgi:hypothetical protein